MAIWNVSWVDRFNHVHAVPCNSTVEVVRLAHSVLGQTPEEDPHGGLKGKNGHHLVVTVGKKVVKIRLQNEEEDPEPPCCSMCDGYHGGPCPLEERGWMDSFNCPPWAQ